MNLKLTDLIDQTAISDLYSDVLVFALTHFRGPNLSCFCRKFLTNADANIDYAEP